MVAPAAHTVQDGDLFGLVPITEQHLSVGRSTGVDQPLEFHARQHVSKFTISIPGGSPGVEVAESGRQDDGADLDLDMLLLLGEVDRTARAKFFAGTALAILKVCTILSIDHRHPGYRLRKREIDCRALTQAKIKFGWDFFPRAFLHARATAGTGRLINISWFAVYCDVEITYIPAYFFHFAVTKQADVGVASHGHHFGCEYSGRTVESGKGFVKAGHVPPDARLALDQSHVLA